MQTKRQWCISEHSVLYGLSHTRWEASSTVNNACSCFIILKTSVEEDTAPEGNREVKWLIALLALIQGLQWYISQGCSSRTPEKAGDGTVFCQSEGRWFPDFCMLEYESSLEGAHAWPCAYSLEEGKGRRKGGEPHAQALKPAAN